MARNVKSPSRVRIPQKHRPSPKTFLPSAATSQSRLDRAVRLAFGLCDPKQIIYTYGWKESDEAFGEIRDEKAWMVEVEYATQKMEAPPQDIQLVTIRLRPGVSNREAHKAADCAIKLLTPIGSHKRKGRPGISTSERLYMDKCFVEVMRHLSFIPRVKQMAEITRLFLKGMGVTRSLKTIEREFKRWKETNGIPVKRYVTARIDTAARLPAKTL